MKIGHVYRRKSFAVDSFTTLGRKGCLRMMQKTTTLEANNWLPNNTARESDILSLPTSPVIHLILSVLAAGENVADLAPRLRQINRNTDISVEEQGDKRYIQYKSPTNDVSIEIDDIKLLRGSNKAAKKLFILALVEANKRALYRGWLKQAEISFPLQLLIDHGLYKTPQSARNGFKAGLDILQSIKVSGNSRINNKARATIDEPSRLFTGATIRRGQCVIGLNPDIDWNFIAQYFTALPSYYFRLPNRASELLYYIFYRARQNTREIDEGGSFSISLRSVQQQLQLPSEKSDRTINYGRDICGQIDKAIKDIEQFQKELFTRDLSLHTKCNSNSSIQEYLANGYLEVRISGELSKTFIEISRDQAQKVAEAKQRKAAIRDQAQARCLAKKMEQEQVNISA